MGMPICKATLVVSKAAFFQRYDDGTFQRNQGVDKCGRVVRVTDSCQDESTLKSK